MRQTTARPLEAERREALEAAVLGPLQARYERLTKAERKIASYVMSRPDCLVLETAAIIARHVGVSEMTVSRFLRKLGFDSRAQVAAWAAQVSQPAGG